MVDLMQTAADIRVRAIGRVERYNGRALLFATCQHLRGEWNDEKYQNYITSLVETHESDIMREMVGVPTPVDRAREAGAI